MKKHIFLVDDDIEEMKIFVAALKDMGDAYKCTYAATGDHALKMLQYLTPETIFINYHLTAMNGLELTKEIRKNAALQHTPVFLYFTELDADSRAQALALGQTHLVEKPDTINGVTMVLKNVFESQTELDVSHT